MNETPTVWWITGLPGAGKSTIAHELATRLRAERPATVLLDGDTLREVLGRTTQFDPESRHELAFVYARLCAMLAAQGLDVVCATVSMFRDVRAWCREHIPGYVVVYLDVPIEVLIERDQKGLYTAALERRADHVLGVNADYEIPESPDLSISSDGGTAPGTLVERILQSRTPIGAPTGFVGKQRDR